MNKAFLITGSTDGIGKLAALKLAKEGHTLYLHGRNAEKLNTVITEIKRQTKNDNIEGFIADFSDLNAVKTMAQNIIDTVPRIDVLINNAGLFKSAISVTKDNLDIRFSINYYAPYILTNALMPLLEKANARVINLSSAAQAPVALSALTDKTSLGIQEGYSQSKLALTMWSLYLAQKHPKLTVIPVNPGSLLNTKMVKEAYGHHWSPIDKGADILLQLSLSDAYREMSGKYFDNDRQNFGNAHPDAYDSPKINTLIKTTDELLEKFM